MKTKLKIAVLAAVLLSSIFLKKRTTKEHDLVFANIEALADWEGGGNPMCMFSGSVDCPISHVKVYSVY